jgi:hypothetical protein
MYTASAVFHLRAGVDPFQLALLGACVLFGGFETVLSVKRGIRSRTCAPWARAGLDIFFITVLMGVLGLSLHVAGVIGFPALTFAAVVALVTRRGHSQVRRQVEAQDRLHRPRNRRA